MAERLKVRRHNIIRDFSQFFFFDEKGGGQELKSLNLIFNA